MDFRTKKKIFVIPPPATGHINPICGVVHELCKNSDLEVIFYSDEPFRELVEKTGASFRALSHPTMSRLKKKVKPITEGTLKLEVLLNEKLNFSYDILPQLIQDVENDEPDLIFYDGFFFPVKFLFEVINMRLEKGTWNRRVPKSVMFIPNFPDSERMVEMARKDKKETFSFWSMLAMMNVFKRQVIFSWWYGISVYNPLKFFTKDDPNLNIVGVTPELQPFREDFDCTYKFVGPCVSEEARSFEINNDPELNSLFNMFQIRNDHQEAKNQDLKLIYISLGTMFTTNIFVFERAIEAIRNYDKKPNRKLKNSQFRVVIAMGDAGVKRFDEKKSSEGFVQPENILIRSKVPQLEVLKRADLIVTHCGMNSTIEAIKFAVPLVALPLNADQPTNAKRICDELEFGISLDPLNFTPDELADAIDQVMTDSKYRDNISSMSKTMSKYNGSVEGAKLILEHLNKGK